MGGRKPLRSGVSFRQRSAQRPTKCVSSLTRCEEALLERPQRALGHRPTYLAQANIGSLPYLPSPTAAWPTRG
eukprot:3076285-Rhodomonas_salina.1